MLRKFELKKYYRIILFEFIFIEIFSILNYIYMIIPILMSRKVRNFTNYKTNNKPIIEYFEIIYGFKVDKIQIEYTQLYSMSICDFWIELFFKNNPHCYIRVNKYSEITYDINILKNKYKEDKKLLPDPVMIKKDYVKNHQIKDLIHNIYKEARLNMYSEEILNNNDKNNLLFSLPFDLKTEILAHL